MEQARSASLSAVETVLGQPAVPRPGIRRWRLAGPVAGGVLRKLRVNYSPTK
jgi:hypothetical protein